MLVSEEHLALHQKSFLHQNEGVCTKSRKLTFPGK